MNFHFTSFKLCTLNISLNYVTYLFSRESLWCKCNLSRFDFTCVFFLKILLFFSMLHYTVTYAFSLKGNATSIFFIFTSLKNFNLHQFRGKILSEFSMFQSKFSKTDLANEKCAQNIFKLSTNFFSQKFVTDVFLF